MRKYKHKVENYIAYEQSQPSPEYEYVVKFSSNKGFLVPKELIENSGDWELVVEKDWEILSFRAYKFPELIWKKQSEGKYGITDHVTRYPIEELLRDPGIYIYEVYRKSDSQIFTIGDQVEEKASKVIRTITEIKTSSKYGILFYYAKDASYTINYINKVSKPKPFITEDGKELYEGDSVCGLNSNFNFINSSITVFGEVHADKGGIKWFSSNDAAKDYIIKNKPIFSYLDIVNLQEGYSNSFLNGRTLIEAKKRIKF